MPPKRLKKDCWEVWKGQWINTLGKGTNFDPDDNPLKFIIRIIWIYKIQWSTMFIYNPFEYSFV